MKRFKRCVLGDFKIKYHKCYSISLKKTPNILRVGKKHKTNLCTLQFILRKNIFVFIIKKTRVVGQRDSIPGPFSTESEAIPLGHRPSYLENSFEFSLKT